MLFLCCCQKSKKSKSALSRHSRRYFERHRSHSLVSDEPLTTEISDEISQNALLDSTAQNKDVSIEHKADESTNFVYISFLY